MMRIWCDGCGAEITDKEHRQVGIPCHLHSMKERVGYVSSDGYPVSGRSDTLTLCIKCWNVGFSAFVGALELTNDPEKLKRRITMKMKEDDETSDR